MAGQSLVDRVVEEYLEEYLKLRPDYATYLGISGYDHLMPSMSLKALEEEARLNRELVERLEGIGETGLGPRERRDRRLALSYAKLWLLHYEKLRVWEMYPEAPDTASSALIPLLLRRDGLEDAVNALKSRIEQIPRMLEESKERLRRPVKPWVQAGIAASRSLSSILSLAARMGSTVAPEIEDVVAKASEAASSYSEWLASRLGEAGGCPVPGRELYEEILRLRGVEEGLEELLRISEEDVKRYRTLLTEALRGSRVSKLGEPTPILPEFSEELARVLDIMGSRAPKDQEEVVWLYNRFIGEAKKFAERLVGDLRCAELDMVETPKHARPLIPVAAYVPPPPFGSGRGTLYVTPPAGAEQLRDHNPYNVCRLVLAEGYPGRHLYATWMPRDRSLVRRVFQAPEIIEGWILYSEELARERGFYREPEHLVLTYLEQLAWAARMRADIKLNAGLASLEEVARELAEALGVPVEQAMGEVLLYPYRPTQQLGPYYGKTAIRRLKILAERMLKERFDEQAFHKALLDEGALPANLLGEAVLSRLCSAEHGDQC